MPRHEERGFYRLCQSVFEKPFFEAKEESDLAMTCIMCIALKMVTGMYSGTLKES